MPSQRPQTHTAAAHSSAGPDVRDPVRDSVRDPVRHPARARRATGITPSLLPPTSFDTSLRGRAGSAAGAIASHGVRSAMPICPSIPGAPPIATPPGSSAGVAEVAEVADSAASPGGARTGTSVVSAAGSAGARSLSSMIYGASPLVSRSTAPACGARLRNSSTTAYTWATAA